jgi:hypothetical protein
MHFQVKITLKNNYHHNTIQTRNLILFVKAGMNPIGLRA